jgi:hypothetical protein
MGGAGAKRIGREYAIRDGSDPGHAGGSGCQGTARGSIPISYTYAMVDRREMADYRSTVAVVPLDDMRCRIELIMHMTPAEGQTEEEVTARYTRNLRGNMRAMKKALGLPL